MQGSPLTVRLLLLLVLWPLCLAAQTLYKYVDEDGRVHYTDRPPADAQSEQLDIRVDSLPGPAAISTQRADHADRLKTAENPAVVIYTTDWCRICRKARRYMDSNGIVYRERDIEKSAAAKQDFDRLGGKGVPLIRVDRQTMHGFDPGALDRLLARQ